MVELKIYLVSATIILLRSEALEDEVLRLLIVVTFLGGESFCVETYFWSRHLYGGGGGLY